MRAAPHARLVLSEILKRRDKPCLINPKPTQPLYAKNTSLPLIFITREREMAMPTPPSPMPIA